MLSALAIVITSYVDWQALGRDTRLTEQAQRVLESTNSVLETTKDAETGQRGYLLTGDASYLAPYNAAVPAIEPSLQGLLGATASEPRQRDRVLRIESLTREKFAEMASTLDAARTLGRQAAIGIVQTDRGQATMEKIRALCADIRHDEYAAMVERSRHLQRQARIGRGVVILSSLILFCLLLAADRAVTRAFARRDRTMRELDESRQLLETTLMGIGDAVICTDAAGRVTLINTVAQQLTGWSEAEAGGKPLDEIFRIAQETSLLAVESPVARVLREGAVVGLANHTVLMSRDGSPLPIDDSGAPIRDRDGRIVGVVLVFRNVAERRSAEKAIYESEERFRTLAAALPQLVWISQAGGQLTYVNPMARQFGGWSDDQIVSEDSWLDLVHPDDRQKYLENWSESLKTAKALEVQCRLRRASDRTYRWVLCRALPVLDSKRVALRWISTCTEIHDQIQSAEKLRRINQALRQSNSDLEQFAYAASHDLQEPLRMVAIYSQLLEQEYRDRLDDEGRSYIRFAVSGARRMEAMLKDLLFYSRVSSGPTDNDEVSDANAALQAAMLNLQVTIQDSGATIEAPHLPAVVIPNLHLVQLFQNLIGNAIKYRRPEPPRIQIRVREDDSRWEFAIQDNGIGIEAAYLNQVFGVFKRLHGQEYEGTGIGLAMCQKIVERNGGRIWVESEPGQGSTFLFTLRADNHSH